MIFLQNGVACIAGVSPATVYAASTVNLGLDPTTVFPVSAGYSSVTTPTLPCFTTPTSQSLTSRVVLVPGEGLVAITVNIGIQTNARQLQAATNLTNIVGNTESQVATILQTIGTNMGGTDPATTASGSGAYNYASIANLAITQGLSPPSRAVLTFMSLWLVSLGNNVRLSQLSSVVVSGGAQAMSINADALTSTARSIMNTPPAQATTNTGAVVGGVMGALTALSIAGVFYITRNRRKAQVPVSASRKVEPVLKFKEYQPTRIPRNVWVPNQVDPITKSDTQDIVQNALAPALELNAARFLQHYKSTPNLIAMKTTKEVSLEDSNGRRAFVSSAARTATTRNIFVDDEDSDMSGAVMPAPRRNESNSTLPETSSIDTEPARKLSSEEKPRRRKSSRSEKKRSHRNVEEEEAPVDEAPVEVKAEEAPKRKKSSRKVDDEDAPKRKKSHRRHEVTE